MDLNHDGAISPDEFTASVLVRAKASRADRAPDDATLKALEFAWAHVLEQLVDAHSSGGEGGEAADGSPHGGETSRSFDREPWLERAAAMFARFDTNRNGCLDADELLRGLATLGVLLSPLQAAALREEVDDDCGGEVTLDAFVTAVRQRARVRDTRVAFARHTAWLKV
jgi:hypothetical protein